MYDRDSDRDSECPCRKDPEDTQTNCRGDFIYSNSDIKHSSSVIVQGDSQWGHRGLVFVTDHPRFTVVRLSIFVTGSCATIDYMHWSIPEIIKVESDLVVFLEVPYPLAGLEVLHSGASLIMGWRRHDMMTELPGTHLLVKVLSQLVCCSLAWIWRRNEDQTSCETTPGPGHIFTLQLVPFLIWGWFASVGLIMD